MPKAFPKEFRDDVVRVLREFDSSIAEVARDVGTLQSCLQWWLAKDDGTRGAVAPKELAAEAAETREMKKRIRLLEQENEVLRRTAAHFAQANLPGK